MITAKLLFSSVDQPAKREIFNSSADLGHTDNINYCIQNHLEMNTQWSFQLGCEDGPWPDGEVMYEVSYRIEILCLFWTREAFSGQICLEYHMSRHMNWTYAIILYFIWYCIIQRNVSMFEMMFSCLQQLDCPVYVLQIVSAKEAGEFCMPPNPGILAFLQRRHCLDLSHQVNNM